MVEHLRSGSVATGRNVASENYASPATLLAMGNWFSDKHAEGTIGRRMYAGCRNVDTVEELDAEHARELFGAEYAYVQPAG
jgi:glycine hydroxymethyltransferase